MHPIAPLLTPLADVDSTLAREGFAVLSPADVDSNRLSSLTTHWNDLPLDPHLRDGGRYRRRRHGCFTVEGDRVEAEPHRAHWQSVDYNALHGGFERWFQPLAPSMANDAGFLAYLHWLGARASALRGMQKWFVEVHPFRIETVDGIGRPTPEGAHRDGVDLVAVSLVARVGVRGGETRVFESDGPRGSRFLLAEPWTTVLLDDARVIHESTPIQPILASAVGHRDTLVVTLRAGGFQSPKTA